MNNGPPGILLQGGNSRLQDFKDSKRFLSM